MKIKPILFTSLAVLFSMTVGSTLSAQSSEPVPGDPAATAVTDSVKPEDSGSKPKKEKGLGGKSRSDASEPGAQRKGPEKVRPPVPGVSEEDMKRLKTAMREARQDPSVKAAAEAHSQRSPEVRDSLRAVIAQKDPSLVPIMEKVNAHREEMKKTRPQGDRPKSPGTLPEGAEQKPEV